MRNTYIVHEIAHATESEDEEINLLDQKTLARLILRMEILAQSRSCHFTDLGAARGIGGCSKVLQLVLHFCSVMGSHEKPSR